MRGPHELPADPLVPVGYERRDTVASLSMLLGNVAVNLAAAGAIGTLNRVVFNRRIANIGSPSRLARGGDRGVGLPLLLGPPLDARGPPVLGQPRLATTRASATTCRRRCASRGRASCCRGCTCRCRCSASRPITSIRAGQLNLLYQYWIHTEAIDRLPRPIEAVFNTPSHHRVHHGSDQQYLDRNYGGVLIVWDRLFGTFEPEIRRVTYGLTKNINTYNPLRIGYHEFADIGRDVIAAKGLRNKLRHVFGRPGWTPSAATRARLDAA